MTAPDLLNQRFPFLNIPLIGFHSFCLIHPIFRQTLFCLRPHFYAFPLGFRRTWVSFTMWLWMRVLCAQPCLSEAEPCCQSASVCVWKMSRWSCEGPPSTLTSQNETLNTRQSVKPVAEIEADLLFHYSTGRLMLLTTCCIRCDNWLQIENPAAQPDTFPSPQHQLNSSCQLLICIRWKQILASAAASCLCHFQFCSATFVYPQIFLTASSFLGADFIFHWLRMWLRLSTPKFGFDSSFF